MSLLASVLVAQLAAAQNIRPVLAFPEQGLDDSAAYAGYTTRFFRDAERNTVQIYLDRREGRVVHLLANGENESVGFSARTADGSPAPVDWDGTEARVWREGRRKLLAYDLRVTAGQGALSLHLGRFVLGSMRVERDVQHFKEHRKAFEAPPYLLPEYDALTRALERQPALFRRAALLALRAPSIQALRLRLVPHLVPHPRPATAAGGRGGATIEQLSLDALDTLRVTFTAHDGAQIEPSTDGRITLRATAAGPLRLRVTVATTGRSLSPLSRAEIFTPEFLAWTESVQRTGDATRARWLERQITGVELLSSREKLMAGLPTYATYFGRDMLLSALMMQPIWRAEMNEFVIAAALRKLSPGGEVSHEEALGGQAQREAAAEVTTLLARADSASPARADSLRRRALTVLDTRRVPRENYHMVDDEYQLPLVAARYLDDTRVSAARKRAWLLGREGKHTRLALLLSELGVVADRSAPYAANPVKANFVPFAPRDATDGAYEGAARWFAQSWRDSGAGYANGKFAMDVNAVYIPHALMATQRILASLRTLDLLTPEIVRDALVQRHPALVAYLHDSHALASAVRTWQSAMREFVVRLSPDAVRTRVAARVAAMPATEQTYWRAFPRTGEGIEFLALALDADGQPIAVANSDPATRLFLDGLMGRVDTTLQGRAMLQRDVSLFAREYPEGLLLPGVGAVVANDAYATAPVWKAFVDDAYHGPRVVWGREVNLFLLGVASHLPSLAAQDVGTAEQLRAAAARVRDAVAASGFRSELWSYDFPAGRPQPIRYGSGGDVQLWSTTDLAVQYMWSRLPQ